MLTKTEIVEIIAKCSYKPNWTVLLKHDHDMYYLQCSVTDVLDSVTGMPTNYKSGKRYLSPHMCRQEVVGVVFAVIKDAEMHEVHEWFRYAGRSIYNPHLDPEALADLASKKGSFICRANAMSMVEL